MPTLFRFLLTIGILAGVVYAAMFALVTFVEPNQGEMSVRIPAERINRNTREECAADRGVFPR